MSEPKKAKQLLMETCQPGDLVRWETLGGNEHRGHEGILKEYDNGTAIVIVDGKEKAVRCR